MLKNSLTVNGNEYPIVYVRDDIYQFVTTSHSSNKRHITLCISCMVRYKVNRFFRKIEFSGLKPKFDYCEHCKSITREGVNNRYTNFYYSFDQCVELEIPLEDNVSHELTILKFHPSYIAIKNKRGQI
jgi:hypothetical protein